MQKKLLKNRFFVEAMEIEVFRILIKYFSEWRPTDWLSHRALMQCSKTGLAMLTECPFYYHCYIRSKEAEFRIALQEAYEAFSVQERLVLVAVEDDPGALKLLYTSLTTVARRMTLVDRHWAIHN